MVFAWFAIKRNTGKEILLTHSMPQSKSNEIMEHSGNY